LVPEDPATQVWRLELSAPLPPGGSRVTISLDGVEGLEGLHVAGWLLPESPAGSAAPLGGTNWFGDPLSVQVGEFAPEYGAIRESPYSASDVFHPMRESASWWVTSGVVAVEPGRYRVLVEAVDSADSAARYGCEIPIEVIVGESLLVTITDLPDFRDDPGRWTAGPDGQYPGCQG
jgi:hypothetical protein